MLTAPLERRADKNLYEQVAERIEQLVLGGTLRPGERAPSVRKLHAQLSVSIATVLGAYRLLEARGVLEARPQSGYYVRPAQLRRAPPAAHLPEPALERLPRRAQRVSCSELALRICRSAQGGEVLQLGAALPSPELLPYRELHRLLARELRRHPREIAQCEFPPGLASLRAQVARRALEAGCALSPDEVLITAGATEALQLCVRAVARPGDTIAVESPAYYGLLQILESLQLKAIELPTSPREGLDLDALEALLARGESVRAIVAQPNASNPLGAIMPDAHKQRLAELVARHRVPLIEDDTFGELCFADQRPKCVKAYDRSGLVMTCSSFSKSLAPGYRVGWVAPGAAWAELERLKLVSSIGTSAPAQFAVAAFLAEGGYDRHLRRLRRTYQDNIELMRQAVCAHFPQGTRAARPLGGHVLWVELPRELDAIALHDAALAEGISIAPGAIFSPTRRYAHCVRLNCGLPWSDEVERGVARVGALASEQLARRTS
jgi:DNA-binding transcriptional MocR family regulator